MTACRDCGLENRSIAKYCKRCGTMLDIQTTDDLLGKLIGLPEVRRVLEDLRATVEGMRRNAQQPRLPFNTLILGNSGTAKSLIGAVIASVLHKLGVVKQPTPVSIDALIPDALTLKDTEAKFNSAKGGVLFVDNVQKLFSSDGAPLPVFTRLVTLIDAAPLDPIVILAGLPFGVTEFLAKRENQNLSGRFQNIFRISDYLPEQLLEIAAHELTSQGFLLPADARAQIDRRLRWLYRQQRMGDTTLNALNGHLAMREAQAVAREYYKRQATDRHLIPADVKGPVERRKTIEEILVELDAFVGMTGIKKEIRDLHDDIMHARSLAARGLGGRQSFAYHFTITGNPGTGKTTVSRVLGEIFESLGVLTTGHVIEVDRDKLVAPFVGQTAPKVHQACDKAVGGVLFIDEAYTLKSGDSFGQEAIDTLLKRMEDDRGKFIVIAAGYPREIADFLKANPGLQSRFSRQFHLADYSAAELTDIFTGMARQQSYSVDEGARAAVLKLFEDRCARKTKEFANGREARTLLESVLRTQGDRVRKAASLSDAEVMQIVAADIPEVGGSSAQVLEAAMGRLQGLVGLEGVKTAVARLRGTLSAKKLMGDTDLLARHFVFTGNPGTGKTTVARILADVFHGLGLLPTRELVEVDESQIIKPFVGQTAPNMSALCDKALGGVLFIDEAYALAKNTGGHNFGKEAIDTLLKRMEDDRGKFIVIAAGYKSPMQTFIDSNPGLRSRFTNYVEFEDYKPAQMQVIFTSLAKQKKLEFEPGFEDALRQLLERIFQSKDANFANAREVRQVFDRAFEACANRVAARSLDEETARRELRVLRISDLGGDAGSAAAGLEAAMSKLNALIGLAGVKRAIARLKHTIEGKKLAGDTEALGKHYVFTGNPGTGKTTVARILAELFHSLGLLPSAKLVEVDRAQLVKGYIGQTAANVHTICDQALGGVLFIDEAYTLTHTTGLNDSIGQEAIDALLKRMEDNRGKFVVIAAGYSGPMQAFIESNPGLRSRFTDFIEFEDYLPGEMGEIFFSMARAKGLRYDDSFTAAVSTMMQNVYDTRTSTFANARAVRQIFDATFEACATRVNAMPSDEATKREKIKTLLPEDLPVASGVRTAVPA
jgi:SpoVK/Ycf46/Vps4 family AAA+-type ATPase